MDKDKKVTLADEICARHIELSKSLFGDRVRDVLKDYSLGLPVLLKITEDDIEVIRHDEFLKDPEPAKTIAKLDIELRDAAKEIARLVSVVKDKDERIKETEKFIEDGGHYLPTSPSLRGSFDNAAKIDRLVTLKAEAMKNFMKGQLCGASDKLEEIERLRLCLEDRDNEIAVLKREINRLNKQFHRAFDRMWGTKEVSKLHPELRDIYEDVLGSRKLKDSDKNRYNLLETVFAYQDMPKIGEKCTDSEHKLHEMIIRLRLDVVDHQAVVAAKDAKIEELKAGQVESEKQLAEKENIIGGYLETVNLCREVFVNYKDVTNAVNGRETAIDVWIGALCGDLRYKNQQVVNLKKQTEDRDQRIAELKAELAAYAAEEVDGVRGEEIEWEKYLGDNPELSISKRDFAGGWNACRRYNLNRNGWVGIFKNNEKTLKFPQSVGLQDRIHGLFDEVKAGQELIETYKREISIVRKNLDDSQREAKELKAGHRCFESVVMDGVELGSIKDIWKIVKKNEKTMNFTHLTAMPDRIQGLFDTISDLTLSVSLKQKTLREVVGVLEANIDMNLYDNATEMADCVRALVDKIEELQQEIRVDQQTFLTRNTDWRDAWDVLEKVFRDNIDVWHFSESTSLGSRISRLFTAIRQSGMDINRFCKPSTSIPVNQPAERAGGEAEAYVVNQLDIANSMHNGLKNAINKVCKDNADLLAFQYPMAPSKQVECMVERIRELDEKVKKAEAFGYKKIDETTGLKISYGDLDRKIKELEAQLEEYAEEAESRTIYTKPTDGRSEDQCRLVVNDLHELFKANTHIHCFRLDVPYVDQFQDVFNKVAEAEAQGKNDHEQLVEALGVCSEFDHVVKYDIEVTVPHRIKDLFRTIVILRKDVERLNGIRSGGDAIWADDKLKEKAWAELGGYGDGAPKHELIFGDGWDAAIKANPIGLDAAVIDLQKPATTFQADSDGTFGELSKYKEWATDLYEVFEGNTDIHDFRKDVSYANQVQKLFDVIKEQKKGMKETRQVFRDNTDVRAWGRQLSLQKRIQDLFDVIKELRAAVVADSSSGGENKQVFLVWFEAPESREVRGVNGHLSNHWTSFTICLETEEAVYRIPYQVSTQHPVDAICHRGLLLELSKENPVVVTDAVIATTTDEGAE